MDGRILLANTAGYTRPLLQGEDLTGDAQELRIAGARRVIREASPRSRDALSAWIDRAGEGHLLLCTSVHRLGHGMAQIVSTVLRLQAKGVAFRSLMEPEFDTTGDNGAHLTAVLGVLDDVHRQTISREVKRSMATTSRPVGRPPVLSDEDVAVALELRRQGRTIADVARVFGVSNGAVGRALRLRPGPAE